MRIEVALEILKDYNKWRRGAEMEMPSPKIIGEAIDQIINYVEKRL